MRKRWTRRGFLQTSLKGSVGVSGALAGIALPRRNAAAQSTAGNDSPAVFGFTQPQRTLLRAAMDEIIPAADGMPAASEVGCGEYLERLASQSPDICKNLAKCLATLEALSHKLFGRSYADLTSSKRVEALTLMENGSDALHFGVLRDFVYEAYYQQPQVWKLIGYEFHATNQSGPHMKPFDDSALAKVRKMPKLYREVS